MLDKIKNLLIFFLKPNKVWCSALYSLPQFSFEKYLGSPIKIFNTKKLRFSMNTPHTLADPFLLSDRGKLYVFLESQSVDSKGVIKALVTDDLINFEDLGVILKNDYHLSYPFVFKHNSSYFLLPESLEAEEVTLYKFANFPQKPVKEKTLLKGKYYDSSLILVENIWYLFTTSKKGLEIFWSEDMLKSDFTPHPMNPITTNLKYSRSAGAPINISGSIYRISQDSSGVYGKNINISIIKKLNKEIFAEEIFIKDYFNNKISKWNLSGGHHMSIAEFKEKFVVATDILTNDYLINKYISPLIRKKSFSEILKLK